MDAVRSLHASCYSSPTMPCQSTFHCGPRPVRCCWLPFATCLWPFPHCPQCCTPLATIASATRPDACLRLHCASLYCFMSRCPPNKDMYRNNGASAVANIALLESHAVFDVENCKPLRSRLLGNEWRPKQWEELWGGSSSNKLNLFVGGVFWEGGGGGGLGRDGTHHDTRVFGSTFEMDESFR